MAVLYAAAELIFRHRRRRYRDHRGRLSTPRRRLSGTIQAIESRCALTLRRASFGARTSRRRTIASTMTVEPQVLCAIRFFGTGSFQGMVATDEHLSVSHMTVSRAVRVFAAAIVFFCNIRRGTNKLVYNSECWKTNKNRVILV
ncbi:hypothetical protein ISCGN_025173 [Ixodes scapularis]